MDPNLILVGWFTFFALFLNIDSEFWLLATFSCSIMSIIFFVCTMHLESGQGQLFILFGSKISFDLLSQKINVFQM